MNSHIPNFLEFMAKGEVPPAHLDSIIPSASI